MDREAWRATVRGGRKESDTTERLNSNNMDPKHQCPHPSVYPGPHSLFPPMSPGYSIPFTLR